jgi:anhydro-N-acetylmuramic acid kinase
MSKLYAALGLMSGTSLDGIDVALIRTDGDDVVQRGPASTFPYAPEQRDLLQEALRQALRLTARDARSPELAAIEREITEWHARAVETFRNQIGLGVSDIELIGFHGQTVLHRPDRLLTIQLGDGQQLADRTQIRVVYDLRAADVAAGGQGAPLVPIYHRALAATIGERPIAFVNIGGVANVTWIGADGELLAFDTGPGNALLDDWALKHTGVAADIDARLAAQGRPNEAVVAQFLGDSYFEEPPPKSLDRNAFASVSLDGLSPQDGAATLVRVTAQAIVMARDWFPEAPKRWIICGGGRKNPAIMASLSARLPDVAAAEAAGFDGDAMEAEAWAYLAVRSLRGLPISFPGTTRVPTPLTGGRTVDPSVTKR